MQYIKHYWISTDTGNYLCDANSINRKHPEAEFPGLNVKVWMHDPDGIDVCLSEVEDGVEINEVMCGDKKAVQILTEEQFNSVAAPLQEVEVLLSQVQQETDESTRNSKIAESQAKRQEAVSALHAL